MITLQMSDARRYEKRRLRETWRGGPSNPLAEAGDCAPARFEAVVEARLRRGAHLPLRSREHGELVTYVCEGVLAYNDSNGRVCVLQAGEFQRATTRPHNRQGTAGVSCTLPAHIFQIWLASPRQAELQPGFEQRRFGRADRRGKLCIVASPDARDGSLRVRGNASIYCGLFAAGQHVVYELAPGRRAWLHVICGEVALGTLVLSTGDGAGFIAERALSLTARGPVEVLLIDGEVTGHQQA